MFTFSQNNTSVFKVTMFRENHSAQHILIILSCFQTERNFISILTTSVFNYLLLTVGYHGTVYTAVEALLRIEK